MLLLREDHLRFFRQHARSAYVDNLTSFVEENELAKLGQAVRPTVREWVERALSGAEAFGFVYERSSAQLILLLLILEDPVGNLPQWAYEVLADGRYDEYQKLRWLVAECERQGLPNLDTMLVFPDLLGRQ